MNSSSKRKLEQQQGQQQSGLDRSKVPVEWVDDHEWNAIQSAFDALSKFSGVVQSSRTVISSSTPPLSMVPSTLSPSSSATAAVCHWSCHSPTTVQSYSCWNVPQSLTQREYHCRTGTCRPNNGEGGSPWKIMGLVPCQLSTRNISLGGGFTILRRQSPNNACSECFSDENTILAKERTEERAEIDSRPSESLGESFQLGGEILHSGMAVGSGRSNIEETLSEAIGPDAEERGGRELSNNKSARRLPAWMMNPAKQWLLPAESASSVVEQREQIRALSGVGGVLVSESLVQEEETRSAIVEQGNVASAPQQTENGHPPFHVQQPQGGRKWGLQPASFVDDLKPKFPTMQFRGQIVYSKTESEVSAATEELWRRVHELQEKAQGAVPIGFDLEWKASFEKGEVPGKVAVLQLCLDGRRCDVMQVIYSGIPTSLQDLLEAPSTLKCSNIALTESQSTWDEVVRLFSWPFFLVLGFLTEVHCHFTCQLTWTQVGVGIYGDASKLRHDYQISTRKLADLRFIANKKIKSLKQWSLASLALELTGKQVEKIRSIRCGNWEALPLSEPQLQYAATDAFASLHLFQVLTSLPNLVHENTQGAGDDSRNDPEVPTT